MRRHAVSEVVYTAEEHALWAMLRRTLTPLHDRVACAPLRAAAARVPLPPHRIPQLHEVSSWLAPLSRFQLQPVTGLVPSRAFLGALGESVFLSTQYIRAPAHPFYTPEPDIVHELLGHAASLAHPQLAALNRLFGHAARSADAATLVELERVYWYTLEFGLLREDGAVKALGAGLLSSVQELQGLCGRGPAPILRDWDLPTLIATPYKTDLPQRTLFVAPSFTHLIERTSAWLVGIAARSQREVAVR